MAKGKKIILRIGYDDYVLDEFDPSELWTLIEFLQGTEKVSRAFQAGLPDHYLKADVSNRITVTIVDKDLVVTKDEWAKILLAQAEKEKSDAS